MITAYIIIAVGFVLITLATLSETAINFCNRLRIEIDIKQEKRYALFMERVIDNKVTLLWSFKVFRGFIIPWISISLGFIVFSRPQIFNLPLLVEVIFIILIISLLFIVIGMIIPFWIASKYSYHILRNTYWFAGLILFLAKPFTLKRANNPSMVMEQDEDSSESELIHNAINFPEVLLRECMIPRTEVVAISWDSTVTQLLNLFKESNYSRIPVYEESIDRIIGYVHSKDMLEERASIKELIRDIDHYSEEMGASDLLTIMIKNRSSIAVVMDKYGGTAGIVTLEDLIEEIFGEISDELDNDEFSEKEIGEGEYILSARLEIKYLNREYELDIPESVEYETLGGFIIWLNENIPDKGDELEYRNLHITILKTKQNRVELVRLKLLSI